MMTGSPIPLWYIEELQNPAKVLAVSDTSLTLEDGSEVELPYIQEIPESHGLFLKALKHGVEVRDDGEVFGLLNLRKLCGNDPVAYRRVRVNLSDLAGVLQPSGLNPEIVPEEMVSFFEEEFAYYSRTERVDGWLLIHMNNVREHVCRSTGSPEPKYNDVVGQSGSHDWRSGGLIQ